MTENTNSEVKPISETVIKKILEPRPIETDFHKMVSGFERKLEAFDFLNNCFDIEKYFGEGAGQSTAFSHLMQDGRIKEEWILDKNKKDFQGLYVFIKDNKAFYFGISKGVIGRIVQHVKGKSHFSASLAYNIGLLHHLELENKEYSHQRKDLLFSKFVEPAKAFLMKQKIAFLPIPDPEELYLFEVYCSMKYKTMLNKFETH